MVAVTTGEFSGGADTAGAPKYSFAFGCDPSKSVQSKISPRVDAVFARLSSSTLDLPRLSAMIASTGRTPSPKKPAQFVPSGSSTGTATNIGFPPTTTRLFSMATKLVYAVAMEYDSPSRMTARLVGASSDWFSIAASLGSKSASTLARAHSVFTTSCSV